MKTDQYNLKRFLDAQEGVYDRVVQELTQGQKRSHWMWYIFPQFKGLGVSETAQKYAIQSLDEAKAYLEHPVLSIRLLECTRLVNEIVDKDIHSIFGYPDDLKFHSCMTLFSHIKKDSIFSKALVRYFSGQPDEKTLELISKGG